MLQPSPGPVKPFPSGRLARELPAPGHRASPRPRCTPATTSPRAFWTPHPSREPGRIGARHAPTSAQGPRCIRARTVPGRYSCGSPPSWSVKRGSKRRTPRPRRWSMPATTGSAACTPEPDPDGTGGTTACAGTLDACVCVRAPSRGNTGSSILPQRDGTFLHEEPPAPRVRVAPGAPEGKMRRSAASPEGNDAAPRGPHALLVRAVRPFPEGESRLGPPFPEGKKACFRGRNPYFGWA